MRHIFLSVAALALLGSCAPLPGPRPSIDMVAVDARPVPLNAADPAQNHIGQLRFMGALHLQSRDSRFGGLSGLRWNNGQLFAISDAGDWFTFRVHEENGLLRAVGPVRIRRLVGEDGVPLSGKTRGDAEALMLDYGDCRIGNCTPLRAHIAFEQDHRIWTYDLKGGTPAGDPETMALPAAWLGQLPANGGMEALAGSDDQRLILAEGGDDSALQAKALIVTGASRGVLRTETSSIPVADGFRPTDADHLQEQEYIALFRRYSLMRGVAARIEHVKIERDSNGAVRIATRLLAELKPPLSVDNMEGLAIRHDGNRLFIYLVSDDNFSGAQRTLLMKFELLQT